MPSNDEMIVDIAKTIAEATGLKNIDFSQVKAETKLIDPPFNLDSIDILEAVASIEDKYDVKIVDSKAGAVHFKNLQTIVDFVNSKN
jgi:acyl carrier protein